MTNPNIIKTLGVAAALSLTACASSTQAGYLSLQAKEAVLTALDDEYKAESLYKTIITKHGEARPFSNIINAETRHSDMLIGLLKTYGETAPQNPYENGVKPKLQSPTTLLEACEIGVTAEIENVALYDDQLLPAVSTYSDITGIMMRLRNASQKRHLPAFQRCVSRGGTMGQGGGMGHGKGKGHSRGKVQH